jgi:hypothetical protein
MRQEVIKMLFPPPSRGLQTSPYTEQRVYREDAMLAWNKALALSRARARALSLACARARANALSYSQPLLTQGDLIRDHIISLRRR